LWRPETVPKVTPHSELPLGLGHEWLASHNADMWTFSPNMHWHENIDAAGQSGEPALLT
jgi:hypothetical protein